MQNFDFSKIVYKYRPISKPKTERVIEAIGFDTEADRDGKTFLYCLSTGDTFTPDNLLEGLFSRKYRGSQFVVFNLKYEQGAILQNLPLEALDILRLKGKVMVDDYTFRVVGYKCLRISKGKNAVTFWDMWTFFNMSLASAARHFTNLTKYDLDVTLFTPDYIASNLDTIKTYCIRDAEITVALFQVLLGMCKRLGINPTTFYSIATIAYKYFRENTDYVTAKYLWDNHRDVLEAACKAYSGGKFEVTTRGKGNFYEYDINSAYPYEMSNLIDMSKPRVVRSNIYKPTAIYGFLYCDIFLPGDDAHPVAYKRGTVNIFPSGHFKQWIGKASYEYLVKLPDAKIKIIKGIWLYARHKTHPYRKIIQRLYEVKAEAKLKDDKELYYFSKKLLNSIYGKTVQLIRKGDTIEASTCWFPIYGAIITENVRIRLAELQVKYPSIVAVHTDSVISTKKLPLAISDGLGDWDFTESGLGIVIGCGFYQVGDKIRVRGFPSQDNIFELLNHSPPTIDIPWTQVITWRQVSVNHWDGSLVNKFREYDDQGHPLTRKLDINFDTKRTWGYKWADGDDAVNTVIESEPFIVF